MEFLIAFGLIALLLLALFQWRRREPTYHDKASVLCAIAKKDALTHRLLALHHAALADMYQQQVQLLKGESNGLDCGSSKSVSPLGHSTRAEIATAMAVPAARS